jgi:hypothetical protein
MENLVIEIGANTKEFLAGLGEVGGKTEGLGDRLKGVGTVAAVAFAGYTASIMGAVYAYREEEKIGQEVNAILRSTGGVAGVTAAKVDELAQALSRQTTFSKESVARGEEILLTYTRIGKDTFPAATEATLDLAQRMGGDAAGAAQVLGRALQDPEAGMKALRKAGVLFTEQQRAQIETMQASGNMAGAQALILKQVESQYGGMAKAAAGGTGAVAQLKNEMEDFVQGVGKKFAPIIAAGAGEVLKLFHAANDNDIFATITAGGLGAGAAISGFVTTVAAGGGIMKNFQVAVEGAKIALDLMGISAKVAIGATGIGLLLVVGLEVYQYWDKIWPAMQAVFKAFVDNVGQAAAGLGKILLGAFRMDIGQIKEGLAQAAEAFAAGAREVAAHVKMPKLFGSDPAATAEAEKSGRDLASAQAAAAARQLMAEEDRMRALKLQAERATNAAVVLEYEHHTAAVVALKKKEAQLLTSLADEKFRGDKSAVRKALEETQAEYDAAYKKEAKSHDKFTKQYLKNTESFQKLSATEQKRFLSAHQAGLVGSMKTEADIKDEAALEDINREIAADNQQLADQEKFGSAYAGINRAMHNSILQQSKGAFDELSQLTNSKNAQMKAVGKVASGTQVAIKTAEGAISAYSSLAGIPIIGPGLGIGAALALTAYGVEREREIFAAAKGGLLTGGIMGVDSIPVLAQHNELIAPPESFEEVVGSVAAKRAAEKQAAAGMDGAPERPPQDVNVHVTVGFKGNASQILTVLVNQDKALGRYRGRQ